MPDEIYIYKFCGNCYWYDVDKDHRDSGWCAERKRKTSCFKVCNKHKFQISVQKQMLDINYPQSIYKHPEPMEMMISTPKDFGQYLQNKRNRRRKK